MSDRSDSTRRRPIPDPEEDVFRHTFLFRLRDSAHYEALLRLGELLGDFLNETHQWGEDDDSLTARALDAAHLDLHRVADYLTVVSQDRFENGLNRRDHRLAERSQRWARRVGRIARAIDREICAPHPPDIGARHRKKTSRRKGARISPDVFTNGSASLATSSPAPSITQEGRR